MGVTTAPVRAGADLATRGVRWLPAWLQTGSALTRLALASVIANVALVVTGGAVRLTNSGLGCPTFPKCTGQSLTPTPKYGINGIIEFVNRQLTFVLVIIAIATLVVALVRRQQNRLALVIALSIPAQAVLGGLTVLTDLNPWLVASHFLVSITLIALTFLLWWRLRETPDTADATADAPATAPATAPAIAVAMLGRLTVAVTAATLVVGTVVTGSGPHAGDKQHGVVRRIGLDVASVTQLHADLVMLLIGLTVGLVVLLRAVRADGRLQRAALGLLAVELAQALIGYTQYFLHVPPLLVGLHMFGACLVWLAALHVVLRAGPGVGYGVRQGRRNSVGSAVRTAG